jgi:hypothetical protein
MFLKKFLKKIGQVCLGSWRNLALHLHFFGIAKRAFYVSIRVYGLSKANIIRQQEHLSVWHVLDHAQVTCASRVSGLRLQ